MNMRQKGVKRLLTPRETRDPSCGSAREMKVTKKFSDVTNNRLRSQLLNIVGCLFLMTFSALVALPVLFKYLPFMLDLFGNSARQHTSLVILKVPSSGSTWLTSLLNNLPSGLVLE